MATPLLQTEPFYIAGKPARYARTGDTDIIWHDAAMNIENPKWQKNTLMSSIIINGFSKDHPTMAGINPWFAVLLEPEESFTMEDYERELLLEEEGKLS